MRISVMPSASTTRSVSHGSWLVAYAHTVSHPAPAPAVVRGRPRARDDDDDSPSSSSRARW